MLTRLVDKFSLVAQPSTLNTLWTEVAARSSGIYAYYSDLGGLISDSLCTEPDLSWARDNGTTIFRTNNGKKMVIGSILLPIFEHKIVSEYIRKSLSAFLIAIKQNTQ